MIGKIVVCMVIAVGMYFVYFTAVDSLHNIGDASLKSQRR